MLQHILPFPLLYTVQHYLFSLAHTTGAHICATGTPALQVMYTHTPHTHTHTHTHHATPLLPTTHTAAPPSTPHTATHICKFTIHTLPHTPAHAHTLHTHFPHTVPFHLCHVPSCTHPRRTRPPHALAVACLLTYASLPSTHRFTCLAFTTVPLPPCTTSHHHAHHGSRPPHTSRYRLAGSFRLSPVAPRLFTYTHRHTTPQHSTCCKNTTRCLRSTAITAPDIYLSSATPGAGTVDRLTPRCTAASAGGLAPARAPDLA